MISTRTRILLEATRQLAHSNYALFTVASVRDALGISSGSMFHAFASKAALAAVVYVDGMADYQRAALTAIARSSDAERSLRSLVRAHLAWVEEHRGLARFMFSTLPDEVMLEAAAPLAAHNAAFHTALDTFYARLHAAGLMDAIDRPLANAICIGPIQEYCRQWVRGDAAKLTSGVVRTLENASLAGLASTRRSKPRRIRSRDLTA